jgi:outer membrane biosynthesis protein TonB
MASGHIVASGEEQPKKSGATISETKDKPKEEAGQEKKEQVKEKNKGEEEKKKKKEEKKEKKEKKEKRKEKRKKKKEEEKKKEKEKREEEKKAKVGEKKEEEKTREKTKQEEKDSTTEITIKREPALSKLQPKVCILVILCPSSALSGPALIFGRNPSNTSAALSVADAELRH